MNDGSSRVWKTLAAARQFILLLLAVASFFALSIHGFATGFADDGRFFEQFIRPVLVEHCIQCHGADKQEGSLRLDQRDAFMMGGESGRLVDLNEWKGSLILQALQHEGLQMPPSKKLPDELIEPFIAWIQNGASWPEYASSISFGNSKSRFTQEDKDYWLFQPMRNSIATEMTLEGTSPANVIDKLVEAKLNEVGLKISEPASPATLVRRVYMDITGVPPSWEELQNYLSNPSSDRYTQLVDQLLADPRYGERWGRYWLDLVRYAESDGFKQDTFRPSAYRYRDYVVRSLNDDKPYAQFVMEQLAGDELDPDSDEMNAATGYLRHWIYEYNQRDVRSQWDNILNDLTDVTGEVFLGISMGCARCHDHKFDPILQKDYYRLQAFFAPIEPRYDIPVSNVDNETWLTAKREWDTKAKPISDRMSELEKEIRDSTVDLTIEKFPPDIRPALRKKPSERDPFEHQLSVLAFLQVQNDLNGIDFAKRLQGEAADEWKRLKKELDELKKSMPKQPDEALTVRDVGPSAPSTEIPGKKEKTCVGPGILSILDPEEMRIQSPNERTTGRRLALAKWITDSNNPFTWRTMVNRIWQHHFQRGLVSNASDLGRLSELPSHPELLDWLALWFKEHNGSLKELHRIILMSRSYQQSSYPEQRSEAMVRDSGNKWLWRYAPRRMDADQIRDSILRCTQELDTRGGGPSEGEDSKRRAIYLKMVRNAPNPLLSTFDAPDGNASVAKRNSTITSLQALYLTNANWSVDRAGTLVKVIRGKSPDLKVAVEEAYRSVLLREPTEDEIENAMRFLRPNSDAKINTSSSDDSAEVEWPMELLTDFCHALLNSNEFLTIE